MSKIEQASLYVLAWLIAALFVLGVAVVARGQSNTCVNGDMILVNTGGTKNFQCLAPNSQPAGTGTTMQIANAGVTGTTVNRLAKLTGAPSTAVITSTSDTDNAVGIVTAGAGTTGTATITILGQASCVFDGATTAGNYFTISATSAGACHDAGSTYPTSGATYGRVLSTNGGGGTYTVELMTPDVAFQNAGNGKSKPGGSNTQVQYNNNNQYGGIANATSDGTTLTMTSPKIITALNDTNGNELFKFTATGSAVNEFTVVNAAASSEPELQATGSDTDIDVKVTPKGAGALVVNQTTAGSISLGNSGTYDAGLIRTAAGVVRTTDGASGNGWIQNTSGRCFTSADATNATTTFSNTSCSVTVTSGRKYSFKLAFFVSDSTAADGAKFDFEGGSATATNFRAHCNLFDTALLLSTQVTALATDMTQATMTGSSLFQCEGTFEPSGSGTFIPRFAQNAHTTGTLTLFRGSYIWFEDMP